MPRAKLTFEERVWLEEALNKKVNHMEICIPLIAHEYISAAARVENTSCIGSPFSNQ